MRTSLSTRSVGYSLIINLLETKHRERTMLVPFQISGYGLNIVPIVLEFVTRVLAALAGHLGQPLDSRGIVALRVWTPREFSTLSNIWLVVIERGLMLVAMAVTPARSKRS